MHRFTSFGFPVVLVSLLTLAPGCGDDADGDGTTGSGNSSNGGSNAGGNNAGGNNVGGQNVGGNNVGGQNVGGDNTGGQNVGGDNTGGQNVGGGSSLDCTPDPQGEPCIECGKVNCCPEAQACAASPTCGPCLQCLDATGDAQGCVGSGACDVTDPTTSAAAQCLVGACGPECGVGG
jgi:hypothetical protein